MPLPDNSLPDSNSLIFYCSRTFDTTSLVHLQKCGGSIHGVFYEMLPTYHRYAYDYAIQEDSLLFFEGYRFVIDSIIWKSVREKAQEILDKGHGLRNKDRYVDGNSYLLYHNFRRIEGNSGNEEDLFEKFDRYLKNAFLQKYMNARKPKIHKNNRLAN